MLSVFVLQLKCICHEQMLKFQESASQQLHGLEIDNSFGGAAAQLLQDPAVLG